MRRIRTVRRWIWAAAALALVYALIPEAPGRVMTDQDRRLVWLVDHGFHVGLILHRDDLAGTPMLDALGARFPDAEWIEFGWGDAGFYTAPTLDDVDAGMVAAALLWPTASVGHAVALDRAPEAYFRADTLTPLWIDAPGRAALRDAVAAAVATPLDDLGSGLYGDSRYYRGAGAYHAFYVCNHWLSDALNAAGLPSSSVWSTAPIGLLTELTLRGS